MSTSDKTKKLQLLGGFAKKKDVPNKASIIGSSLMLQREDSDGDTTTVKTLFSVALPNADENAPTLGADDTTQSDWNQNDETKPDYVKNRPFWTDDPVETEIFNHVFSHDLPIYEGDSIGLTPDRNYTVTITANGNEETYTSRSIKIDDGVAIGNLSIWGIGEDTGEPFFAFDVLVADQCEIDVNSSLFNKFISPEVTFTVRGITQEIHSIPSKFLPAASDTDDGVTNNTKIKRLVRDNEGLEVRIGETTYAELKKHLNKTALPCIYFTIHTNSIDFNYMVMSYFISIGFKGIVYMSGLDFRNGIVSDVNIIFPLNDENDIDNDSVIENIAFFAPTYTILTATDSSDKFKISVNASGEITATKITTE